MAIKTLNINTVESVKKKPTSDWNNSKNNTKIKINDKISPTISVTNKNNTVNSTPLSDTSTKVTSKLSDGVTIAVVNDVKNNIDLKDFTVTSQTSKVMQTNMINKITKQLTSPGMPLNKKSKLSNIIDKICNASGKSQLGLNRDLYNILSALGLDELLKLLACLSDPSKLVNTVISMLTNTIDNNAIKSGLKTTIQTGKVDTKSALNIVKNEVGDNIIKHDKDILNVFNKDVDTKNNINNTDANELYTTLPKDNKSMCVYGENKDGLFNTLTDKQNKNKNKDNLTNTPTPLDTASKNKIFMLYYNNDVNKVTFF